MGANFLKNLSWAELEPHVYHYMKKKFS